jgi:hypothetical protein
LNRCLRDALVVALLSCLLAGCGSGDQETQANQAKAAIPSPNRRILSNEKYKDLIGKDGKPIWKPGQKMLPPTDQPNR